MELGITVGHHNETVRMIADLAAYAEDAGLARLGFSDSQAVFRETYCAMTAAGLATSRIRFATTATNVTTRHPGLTASAAATVDELTGGRLALTVGTGESSVKNLGLQRAKPGELRAGVTAIRQAFRDSLDVAGGKDPGRTVLLSFATRAVPVIVSCSTSGPMAMRVGAEAADGVLLIGDVSHEVMADRIAKLRTMRAAGPLAGERFSIWLYAPGYISDDLTEARSAVRGVVGSVAVSLLDANVPAHGIPEDLRAPFTEFQRSYSYAKHAAPPPSGQPDPMDELGLADHLYSRLALVGTEDEVALRLAQLEGLGVESVIFTGALPDKRLLMDRLGQLQKRLDQRSDSLTATAV